MYLESATITNIKCFSEITLDFKASRTNEPNYDPQQNWNVILGDNGEGKTTLLQAIASRLMDGATLPRVTNLSKWVRHDEPNGTINIAIIREAGDFLSPESQLAKALPVMGKLELAWNFRFGGTDWASDSASLRKYYLAPNGLKSQLFEQAMQDLLSSLFGSEKTKGWVSCGYGPFRRLYGPQLNHSDSPLEERFITLFDERAALYQCEAWLKDLERLALRHGNASPQQKTFEEIKQLIVELLPNIDEVQLLDEGPQFWYKGQPVSIQELSDGYRSMFALIVDLLRWLEMLRTDTTLPLNEAAGVVLIDEIDAHLHPKWQREVGFLLTRIFPNIQFIVTSHSPFVAMAAGEGALTLLSGQDGKVIANQEIPFVRDWTVDRVLGEIFEVHEHSWQTEQELNEYQNLRFKEIAGRLDTKGQARLNRLRSDLDERLAGEPSSPQEQSLASDLAYLKSLIKQKRESAHAQN